MKNKKHVIYLLFVAVIVIVLAVALILKKSNKDQATEKVKIGFTIALTGSASGAAKPIQNSIDFLREKYPNVEFIVEDSKSSPMGGIQATRKLVEIDKVDLVYCDLTNVTAAIVDYTETKNTILVATVFMDEFLDKGKYTIRNFMTSEDQINAIMPKLKELINNQSNIRILSATSNDEFGKSSLKGLKKVFLENNIPIINSYEFTNDIESIRNVAMQIKNEKPDFVYVSSFSASLGNMIKELRTNGVEGYIITSTALTFPFIRNAAGDAVYKIIHTDFPHTKEYDKYVTMYNERFGDVPPLTAFLCYDGISLLLSAINKKMTNEDLLNKLEGVTYEGGYGLLKYSKREIKYPLRYTFIK